MAIVTFTLSIYAKSVFQPSSFNQSFDFMSSENSMAALLACQLPATSKKQVLQTLSELIAARTSLCERAVLGALVKREKLGSTAIGAGLALPHSMLDGLDSPTYLIATLAQPVEFDAPDGKPVDVICVVLGSADDSSGYLARVTAASRLLRERAAHLRSVGSEDELRAVIQSDLVAAA
jgi:PTS system nitrogen regulatory IIA component